MQNYNNEVATPTIEVKATPVHGKAGEFNVNYRYGNQNRTVTVLDPANHQKTEGDKVIASKTENKRRIIRDPKKNKNNNTNDDLIRTTSGKTAPKKPKR